MTLSKTQQDLLDAMKRGVVVFLRNNPSAGHYFERSDRHDRFCTASAQAMLKRGLARIEDDKLILTEPAK